MTPGQSDRVQALFDQAAQLPPEERTAFLDAVCLDDPTLRAEVEGLLAYDAGPSRDTSADHLLKSPLVRASREPFPVHSEEALPAQFGCYSILRKLGQGGMGIVYLAEQTNPPRKVALKILSAPRLSSVAEQRFQIEAAATARLQHPHIVEIFEVGEHDGRPFLVLEYLDGGSLDERLKKQPMAPHEAAGLIQTLARAIHFAHCQGFIHRDLKPANILFAGTRDEGQGTREAEKTLEAGSSLPFVPRLSSLVPKITDFGLALPAGNPSDLTHSQQVLGTPSYMAPEQARGHRPRVGPATDVYALGVILYECLTGRRPFQGESPLEVMQLLVHSDPVSPRRHRPALSRDLEAICLKCLNKDPEQRYPSAGELAEDLERFRQGKTTRARPVGTVARFGRWCARHPVTAGLLATLAVVFVVSFALVTWKWREADERAEAETRAREEGDRLRRELARESSLALLRLGMSQAQEGSVVQGMQSMTRALVLAEDEGQADLERVLRLNLAHWQRRLILPRTHPIQQRPILRTKASPDGRWLATIEPPNYVGKVWDLADEQATALDLGEGVQHVAFSRDSEVVMVASGEAGRVSGEVRLWRRRAARESDPVFEPWGLPLRVGAPVLKLILSPDRQTLAVLLLQKVQLWDMTSRSLVGPPLPCETWSSGEGCIGMNETLTTLGPDDTVCRWDSRTGKALGAPRKFAPPEKNPLGTPQKVVLRALSPDGRTLAATVQDVGKKTGTHVRLWDLTTGESSGATPESSRRHRDLTFSPDGRVLALRREGAGDREEEVQLYDAPSGQLLGVPMLHPRSVNSLAFGPENRLLVTVSEDDCVRFWETATGQAIGQATDSGKSSVAFGQRLITVPRSQKAKLWEVSPGSVGWTSLPRPPEWRVTLSFSTLSPNGRTVAVTPFQRTVQAWDLTTGRAVTGPLQHNELVTSVAFDPLGKTLLTGCADGSVWLWEVPSGRPLGLQVRYPGKISPTSRFHSYLSPDGQTLLTCGTNETAQLWDARTRQPQGGELRHAGRIQGGAFSRDGRKAATVSVDGVAQVWEAKTGRLLGSQRHPAGVLAAAFSSDGTQLLTGCEDGVARLWEPETGTLRQSWTHRAPVNCVGFSPDGRTFFTGTGSPEGQVRLWDHATGLPLGPSLGPLGVPEHHVLWLEFSPDGRRLAMGGVGSSMPRLWDLPEPVPGTARQVQSWVRSHTGAVSPSSEIKRER